jgi:hypothetical protein
MSQFPVKPDTVVILPNRDAHLAAKKQPPRKRPVPPEEQVLNLRKQLRRTRRALALLVLLLGLAVCLLVQHYLSENSILPGGQACTVHTTSQI